MSIFAPFQGTCPQYPVNALAKEESWRLFKIMGEFVEGFDALPKVLPAVTIYGGCAVSDHPHG